VNAPSQIALDWKGLDSIVLAEAGVTRGADGTVRVPYRDVTGAERNAKLFGHGRSWWEQRGLGASLFGLERVADPARRELRRLWICEGESDALSLREHYAEWRRLPVDIVGLPGAATWRPEWAVYARGYSSAACFPDGDQAGDLMADKITASVPWTIRVRLPEGRDVRSILQAEGPDALDECITRGEWAMLMWAGMKTCRTITELERWISEVEW
jgi:hypothetical protein